MSNERPNIRRLNVLEKSDFVGFDPDRDLIREDWSNIRKSIDYARAAGDFEGLAEKCAWVSIIDPNRAEHLSDEDWREIQKLEPPRTSTVVIAIEELAFLKFAACARMLDSSHPIELNDQFIQNVIEKVAIDWHNSAIWWLRTAAYLKIFRPDIAITFTQKQIQGIREYVAELEKKGDFKEFAKEAGLMRLVGLEIRLSSKEWAVVREAAREALDRKGSALGGPASEPVINLLANMKILAAKDVRVTENGLELTMPKQKDANATTPVPATSEL